MPNLYLTRSVAAYIDDHGLDSADRAVLRNLTKGSPTPGDHPELIRRAPVAVVSIRASQGRRIFCSMSGKPFDRSVWLWYIGRDHDEGYRRIGRMSSTSLEQSRTDWADIERILETSQPPAGERFFGVGEDLPEQGAVFYRELDRHLALDSKQSELRSERRANLLVSGGPGTGKTVLAIYRAIDLLLEDPECSAYIMTFNVPMRAVCRAYVKSCLGDSALGRIHLPTMQRFISDLPSAFRVEGTMSESESLDVVCRLQGGGLPSDASVRRLFRNIRGLVLERAPGYARQIIKQHGRSEFEAVRLVAEQYAHLKGERHSGTT